MFPYNLPDLVILKIFDYLCLVYLVKCRNVSKKWKSLVDEKIKNKEELILFINLPIIETSFWRYNREKINLNYSLSVSETIISSEAFLNLFKSLKIRKLLVYSYEIHDLREKILPLIDYFKESLEHLQMEFRMVSSFWSEKRKVNFPKLKSFIFSSEFRADPFGDCEDFNLPSLEHFSSTLFHLNKKKLEWIKNLKYFCFFEYSYYSKNHFSLVWPNFIFSNLEILCISNESSKIPISIFPSLKELYIYIIFKDISGDENKSFVNFYQQEKIRNKKHDLDIYVDGFKLNDVLIQQLFINNEQGPYLSSESYLNYHRNNHLEYKSCEERLDSFVFTNTFITSIDSIKSLKYNIIDQLVYCFLGSYSTNLKNLDIVFKNVIQIILEDAVQQESLDLLPKYCPNAFNIKFSEFEYDTPVVDIKANYLEWCEKLPYCEKKYHYLKIAVFLIKSPNDWDLKKLTRKDVDFTFLSKFKRAKEIIFNHFEISFKELREIVENCKYLGFVSFRGIVFKIEENSKVTLRLQKEGIIRKFETKLDFLDYIKARITIEEQKITHFSFEDKGYYTEERIREIHSFLLRRDDLDIEPTALLNKLNVLKNN